MLEESFAEMLLWFLVQEFFIKHMDGSSISSEAEKQRVILCLRASIERRASQVLRLLLHINHFSRII